MEFSNKGMNVSPSATLVIDAKAKKMKAEGIDVIGFGAGEPDFDTPKHIRQAAINAINDGFTRYTPSAGILELRGSICRKLEKDNNLKYKPSEIVVSNGAKHSLINTFTAILNPGDQVIIPAPYWVSYPEMVKLADGEPVIMPTKEEDGFKIEIEVLESVINSNTRAIVLNSPSNPTGMLYTREELEKIANIALKNNIYLISDEIYEKLVYDGCEHVSVASLGEKIKDLTIIVNGVSKAYAMTGWRIGYTASSERLAQIMGNIQSHATSNPNSIAQIAALSALDGPQDDVDEMRKAFIERRDYMVEKINSMEKVSCIKPDGAFYVMMNISKVLGSKYKGKLIKSSDDFAECLLENKNVAVVPGSGFGVDSYVRLSYATSMENIKIGLERIQSFLNEIGN